MNKEKIENLWKWFVNNEQQIIEAVKNETASEYLIENLDNLILDLGMFKWEIGRGDIQPYCLTISPNGDKELLKISKEVIENAPKMDQWEFNYSEPAKEWDLTFTIYDDKMDVQNIDASDWNFVALEDNNGLIQLILEADIGYLDSETALIAADLVVIGEIGEEARIQRISSVKIVEQVENQHKSMKANIQELKNSI